MCTATLRGRALQLTSEEFDVLVFLVGHPKSFITPHTVLAKSDPRRTRAEIFWNLLSLRNKLDAAGDPGKHYLRTEPWIAYRFNLTSLSHNLKGTKIPLVDERSQDHALNLCKVHQCNVIQPIVCSIFMNMESL